MSANENRKNKTARKKKAKPSGSAIKKSPGQGIKKAVVKKAGSGSAKKAVTGKGPRKKSAAKKAAIKKATGKGGGKKGDKKTDNKGNSSPSSASESNGGVHKKGDAGNIGGKSEALVVNLAQIVQLFGVTSQAFNKWKAKETFPQEAVLGYNKFDLMAVFTWYREDIIGGKDLKQRKHMASVEKIEAEERRISYDGRSKFIKALIDENKVVETSKVVRDVGEIVATLASDLEGAKKRLPTIFANKSEKELMLLADTEIDSLKIRLHSSSMKLAGKYAVEGKN